MYLGHRISIDLDFFTAGSFSVDAIEERLKELGSYTQKRIAENTLICVIAEVQFSLFKYSYPPLDPPEHYQGINGPALNYFFQTWQEH